MLGFETDNSSYAASAESLLPTTSGCKWRMKLAQSSIYRHPEKNTEANTFQLPSGVIQSLMVLWRPGLRLYAPGVEFSLDYRDLDRYCTNELQRFTREAARFYDGSENSERYTRTSLKQLLSSINIAWDIIDERRTARRIPVLDSGYITTGTVYVRPSSVV